MMITIDSRLKFVILTIVLSLVSDLIAWWLHTGWIGAAIITSVLNALIIGYIISTKDKLLARLFFFGILVGFGELPSDYLAVAVQQTLVYAPDEPFIWKSPFYMPFSWAVVMVQIGYIALWMIRHWGLTTATVLTGILGGINLPTYEFIAKQADFWYYQNCPMVFFDSTPVYVIAGEVLITLSLPVILHQVQKCRMITIAGWAVLEALWMVIATTIAYRLFG